MSYTNEVIDECLRMVAHYAAIYDVSQMTPENEPDDDYMEIRTIIRDLRLLFRAAVIKIQDSFAGSFPVDDELVAVRDITYHIQLLYEIIESKRQMRNFALIVGKSLI
jgi:hypothetical protein